MNKVHRSLPIRSYRRLSVWAAIPATAALIAGLVVSVQSAAAVSPTKAPATSGAGIITTFAGGGVGDGGPATNAPLGSDPIAPRGLAADRSGNVFVATSGFLLPQATGLDRVREIAASSGVITTAAGTRTGGFSGDGASATSAQLSIPYDVGFDGAGNMYELDDGNERVRKVAAGSGIITTVAGGAKGNLPGFGGDGGPATKATLAVYEDATPLLTRNYFISTGFAVDRAGDLFIADTGNGRVRRVDGRSGIITTVAGTGFNSSFSDLGGVGDGGPATAAALTGPGDVAVDAAGNLYIADVQNFPFGDGSRVRRVDAQTGIITTVAGGGSPSDGLGDGGAATSAAMLPICVDFDPAGNLVICDGSNGRVRRVDRNTGIITTIAGGGSPPDGLGDGGAATSASLSLNDIGFDPAGNLYISDNNNGRVRKVSAGTGIITTIAGGPDKIGDGLPATSAVLLPGSGAPLGLTSSGPNTYIAEVSDGRVRRVDGSGVITTFAGGGHPGDGRGDGGPATAAALVGPFRLASDAAGDVFIRDGNRVRKVDGGTGIITTFAGGGTPPDGLGDGGPATAASIQPFDGLFVVPAGNARWPAGTVFIADGTRVRMVDPAGTIITVAGNGQGGFGGDGGPARQAGFGAVDVVVDQAGNLFLADLANSRVRRVDAASRIITTVAGNGQFGLAGEGGPAVQAHLNNPSALAIDPAGEVYISDAYHRVVMVDRAGNLQLVAGTGAVGSGGDGSPARYASLAGPGPLAFDGAGDLFISDADRVRVVRPGGSPHSAGCGAVITQSTTLTADVGPCKGNGIILGADNITLNLNGHRVFGAAPQDGASAGILVSGRTKVTVTGGQVDHFSAGVAVVNSTYSTVSNLVVQDNVGSYYQLLWADGIVLNYSSHNTIRNNTVRFNGIFDNVGVLGRLSDYNVLQDNTITDGVGIDQGAIDGTGEGITYNAFLDFSYPDRGASLVGNQVLGNTVLRSYANGISDRASIGAQIIGNTSNDNGVGDLKNGIGIGLLPQGASTRFLHGLVQGNTALDNTAWGIQSGNVSGYGSRFIGNTALGNGIKNPPGYRYFSDLEDGGPPCGNFWAGNTYNRASPCAATTGHQIPPAAPLAPQAMSPSIQPLPAASPVLPPRTPGPVGPRTGHRYTGP